MLNVKRVKPHRSTKIANCLGFELNYPNKEIVQHFYNRLNVNVHLLASHCITTSSHISVLATLFACALSLRSEQSENFDDPHETPVPCKNTCTRNRHHFDVAELRRQNSFWWCRKINRINWDKSFNCPSICSSIISSHVMHTARV